MGIKLLMLWSKVSGKIPSKQTRKNHGIAEQQGLGDQLDQSLNTDWSGKDLNWGKRVF